nr:unnamed protein product [Callosobruchus chinensis]
MHVLSACKKYAGTAYVHRHKAALRVLCYHLKHWYGIDETLVLPYAPGDIEPVVENERCLIYWNNSFPMLELVQANKPDIKTMCVIEISAPAEVNIVSKEEEKRTEYQELLGQLQRLWPDNAVLVIGSLCGMSDSNCSPHGVGSSRCGMEQQARFDVRGRSFHQAKLWSSARAFGDRAHFRATTAPATLIIDDVRLDDEGVYRCRVDFRNSPTRNSKNFRPYFLSHKRKLAKPTHADRQTDRYE